MSERMECIVCGRRFYRGQGVRIEAAGVELVFHSKVCALRFVRSLLEHLEPNVLKRGVSETLTEFREARKKLEDARAKTI